MRFLTFRANGRKGLAASKDGADFRGLMEGDAGYPVFLLTGRRPA